MCLRTGATIRGGPRAAVRAWSESEWNESELCVNRGNYLPGAEQTRLTSSILIYSSRLSIPPISRLYCRLDLLAMILPS
jgi:hypothetical protein